MCADEHILYFRGGSMISTIPDQKYKINDVGYVLYNGKIVKVLITGVHGLPKKPSTPTYGNMNRVEYFIRYSVFILLENQHSSTNVLETTYTENYIFTTPEELFEAIKP